MLSLLHQTTLTITAVLVLISCAIQAQAIDGSTLYARNYIEQRATNEGLSNLRWIDGGSAYMTCTPINIEKAI
ncbi:hypothetical protein BDF22DRAFT_672155 [Syncephalis plumigaleata]|nr:hypothetical protein BDF22DRAFT_672155 [Syncephalis plumigaleata]